MLQGAKWMLKNLHSKCLFWKWVSKDRFPVFPDLLKNNEWFFINHLNFCYLIIIIIFCDYTFLRVSAFTEKKSKSFFQALRKRKNIKWKKDHNNSISFENLIATIFGNERNGLEWKFHTHRVISSDDIKRIKN